MSETSAKPEPRDLEVSFLAEVVEDGGGVVVRFSDPSFGVRLPNLHPVVLMVPPGGSFDVVVGTCLPRRLVAREGAICIVEHRSELGQFRAGVRVDGAFDPDEEARR